MKRKIGLVLLAITLLISTLGLQPHRMVFGNTTDKHIYLPLVIKDFPFVPKIAFISERDGNREIYVIKSDGSNLTRLTNNTAEDFDHFWASDGDQMVYRSEQDGNSEIYIVDVDGSNPTRLTNNTSFDGRPSWSPDGSKIAYITDRHGASNNEIYLINPNGTGEARLTNNSTNDNYPIWSPNGNQIAFVGDGEIFIIDANGANLTPVTSISDVYVYDIYWSPDGNKIAFRGEVGSNQEIFVVDANGTGLTNLTNSPLVDLTPKWSPTGDKLAYICHFKLCTMNSDGSDLKELTGNAGQYPTWSPTGKSIIFSSDRDGNSEIYTINSDGSGLNRLTNHSSSDWRPVSQP